MKNIIKLLYICCLTLMVNGVLAQGSVMYPGNGIGFDSGCGYPNAGVANPATSDVGLAGGMCGAAYTVNQAGLIETATGFDITGYELLGFDIDMDGVYGFRMFYGPQNNCCTICFDFALNLNQGSTCGTFGPQTDLSVFGYAPPINFGQDVFNQDLIPYTNMCPNTEYFVNYQPLQLSNDDTTDPDGNDCGFDDTAIVSTGTLSEGTIIAPGVRDPLLINATTLTVAAGTDCTSPEILIDFSAEVLAGCTAFGTDRACSQGLELVFRSVNFACGDVFTSGPVLNDPTNCFVGVAGMPLEGQISLGTGVAVCDILACDPAATIELYATYLFCEADDIAGDGSGNDEAVFPIDLATVLAGIDCTNCAPPACEPYDAISTGLFCNGYEVCLGYSDASGFDATGTTVSISEASGLTPTIVNDGMTDLVAFDADGDGVNESTGYCYSVTLENLDCAPVPYTPLLTATCPDGTPAVANGITLTNVDYFDAIFGLGAGGTAAYPALTGFITPAVCPDALGVGGVAAFAEVFVADAAGNPVGAACTTVSGAIPAACDDMNTTDTAVPVQFNPITDPVLLGQVGPDNFGCGFNATADFTFTCTTCEPPPVGCQGDPDYIAPIAACSAVDADGDGNLEANYTLTPGPNCTNPNSIAFPGDDRYDYFVTIYIDPVTMAVGPAPAGYDPVTATNTFAPDLANVLTGTVGDVVGTANGSQCTTPVGLILTNPTCTPIDFTFFIVPIDFDSDLDGDMMFGDVLDDADANYCVPVRLDVTVYPNLTATVIDDGSSCGTAQVDLLTEDGATVCDSQTLVCAANDDVLNADFSATTTDPLNCSTLTAMVTCAGCVQEECSITPDVATNIICNDNGTPTDPADDTFTFDITVNGNNTAAGAANTFNDDQGNAGIAYGTTVSYGPYPIAGGNVVVNFTDADDGACTGMMMAAPPATCSGESCGITPEMATNIVCNDNGTPTDPADDTFTFDITVNGNNPAAGASNTFNDDQGNAGIAYGTIVSYGPYPIAGGNVVVNFTDADDVACTGMMMATPTATCSAVCEDSIMGSVFTDDPMCSADVVDFSGISVTIIDLSTGMEVPGSPVLTDAMGNYTLAGPFPCGQYSVELDTATLPTCYQSLEGETGPIEFNVNGDGNPDGADFSNVAQIPTLSQWGLMSLALLLMIFGALKLRTVTVTNLKTRSN